MSIIEKNTSFKYEKSSVSLVTWFTNNFMHSKANTIGSLVEGPIHGSAYKNVAVNNKFGIFCVCLWYSFIQGL